MSRRAFLRTMARAGGASAVLASFPPAIQRALALPANGRTRSLQDVEHIVVLTQENRSFDHYFGTLEGVRGYADPFPIPVMDRQGLYDRKSAFVQQTVDGRATAPFRLNTVQDFNVMRVAGTPHTWLDAQLAWDHGRMNDWCNAKQNHSMGHYAEADIPFQFALARAFTICDHYHCATQTGTNTNRLFLFTGHNDPLGAAGGPSTDNSHEDFQPDPATDYLWTTYPERLQAAGISWQVYQNTADNFTDNPLAGFRPFRDAWYGRPGHAQALRERGVSTRDLDLLKADVLADRLPQVSWIIATAEGSEHPGPSSPASGADYIARVLDALTANPDSWSKTVFLVNFDENDGFFDHMPPPSVPSITTDGSDPAQARLAGASTVDTTGEYHHLLNGADARTLHRPYGLGPRVPMYVISPWTKGGWVNSQVFDHSSVVRFIEARFGVHEPLISPWRRSVSGNLLSCFDFANPHDGEFRQQLPDTAARRAMAVSLAGTKVPPVPAGLWAPVQAAGVRPARALPYELQVQARVFAQVSAAGGEVELTFENAGEAGAVFHVYDRLALDRIPRRYTVEPGKQLTGRWSAGPAYDLWVLGPNGFHRHIAGDAHGAAGAAWPETILRAERRSGELVIDLVNNGSQPCAFRLVANKYGTKELPDVRVAAQSRSTVRLSLAASHNWYDYSVRVNGVPGWLRRFAGHLENGQPSISDPAMHGPAQLDQYRII
jgi:phospholipase C